MFSLCFSVIKCALANIILLYTFPQSLGTPAPLTELNSTMSLGCLAQNVNVQGAGCIFIQRDTEICSRAVFPNCESDLTFLAGTNALPCDFLTETSAISSDMSKGGNKIFVKIVLSYFFGVLLSYSFLAILAAPMKFIKDYKKRQSSAVASEKEGATAPLLHVGRALCTLFPFLTPNLCTLKSENLPTPLVF